jgi:hypothetical protein
MFPLPQKIVQDLIAVIDSAVDAGFVQKASLQLENVLEQLYLSAVDKLAGHLGAKLTALMEVSMYVCMYVCMLARN